MNKDFENNNLNMMNGTDLVQYESTTTITSFFNLEVLAAFAVIVAVLIDFINRTSGHLSDLEGAGISTYAYFMAGATVIFILILFICGGRVSKYNSFLWLAVSYVLFAFISTVLSGMYTIQRLPFRFINMFFWVAVMLLSYYSVLRLNTLKFHVAVIVLFLPFLAYKFLVVRNTNVSGSAFLLLNPVFFIAFFMPVVLLLMSKLIKISFLLLIFLVVLLQIRFTRQFLVFCIIDLLLCYYALVKMRERIAVLYRCWMLLV